MQQKEEILSSLDNANLLPVVKEIIDELSRSTKELKESLENRLRNPDALGDWRDHAKLWVQIYSKWNDRESIEKEIIIDSLSFHLE